MSEFWKTGLKTITPDLVLNTWGEARRQVRAIRLMREAAVAAGRTGEPADWYDIVVETPYLRSHQIKSEIVRFVNMIMAAGVSTCLEIGTAKGGTLFMLMQGCSPRATIISLDLFNSYDQRLRLQFAGQRGQKVFILEGDSHSTDTLDRVRRLPHGSELDLLFIDGDHTYDGVKQDFEMYAPLVKEGGIIAFHDIVPDYMTRYGRKTSSYSGDVYKFWGEIRERYESVEIVEDAGQDGFGIGVLFK